MLVEKSDHAEGQPHCYQYYQNLNIYFHSDIRAKHILWIFFPDFANMKMRRTDAYTLRKA
jgi:hypothetical protein